MLKPDNLVCFQCLFARKVVHEKEETTEREEEDDEEDKSSDEGLLLQAHHAMERMEEFVHKVRGSSSSLMHTFVSQLRKQMCIIIEFICRGSYGEIKRMTSAHLTRAECSQLLLHEHATVHQYGRQPCQTRRPSPGSSSLSSQSCIESAICKETRTGTESCPFYHVLQC